MISAQPAAPTTNEQAIVEGIVSNYFYELNEQGQTSIVFQVEGSKKLSNNHYEVSVTKIVDGLEYPVIPYDVFKENEQWIFDNSSIVVYPKNEVEKMFQMISESGYQANPDAFYTNVVAENNNFFVKKFIPQQNVSLLAELNYSFRVKSIDIYNNGTIDVYTNPLLNTEPDDWFNFVVIELYDEDPIDNSFVTSRIVDAFDNDMESFTWPGYVAFNAYNFNYPWLSGVYTVVYN